MMPSAPIPTWKWRYTNEPSISSRIGDMARLGGHSRRRGFCLTCALKEAGNAGGTRSQFVIDTDRRYAAHVRVCTSTIIANTNTQKSGSLEFRRRLQDPPTATKGRQPTHGRGIDNSNQCARNYKVDRWELWQRQKQELVSSQKFQHG